MPIDANTVCPGGTGKRVGDCCPGRVADLDAVVRLIEGRQFRAALQRIDKLQSTHPDLPCLIMLKFDILGELQRLDELNQLIDHFSETHPDNPLACCLAAMRKAGTGAIAEAVEQAVHGWECCGEEVDQRVVASLGEVMRNCVWQHQFIPGLALAERWGGMFFEKPHLECLKSLSGNARIPVLIKCAARLKKIRDGQEPWAALFREASGEAQQGHWLKARNQFEQLAEQYPEVPEIRWNLAVLRARLGDLKGAQAAWEKFAAMDVALEDAVEAQAIVFAISDPVLGDPLPLYEIRYRVSDAARLSNLLYWSERTVPTPQEFVDPVVAELAEWSEEERERFEPLASFQLYDREARAPQSRTEVDAIPYKLAELCIYRVRGTECVTLWVTQVESDDLDVVRALLDGLAGGVIELEGEPKQVAQLSRSLLLLERFRWWSPLSHPLADSARLVTRWVEKACLEMWPGMALGALDGLTPEAAAADPKYRVRLLAAILVLEGHWETLNKGVDFDFNRLRSKLGLPMLEPIQFVPTGEELLERFPMTRLHRVNPEPIADDDLLRLLNYASVWGGRRAMLWGARAVLQPSRKLTDDLRLACLRMVVDLTVQADEAFQAIEQAKQCCGRLGQPHSAWHWAEAQWQHRTGQHRKVQQVVAHVLEHHQQEESALELLGWAYATGYIDDDGQMLPLERESEQDQAGLLVVPGAPDGKPGGLWLPEGQQAEAGQRRLWVPGDQ